MPMANRTSHGPGCCPESDEASWLPSSRRRWSIWEIPGNLQCSIIGTCLSHEDLLTVTRRLKLEIKPGTSAYDVHAYFVNEAARNGPAARALQKELDKRFAGLLRRVGRFENDDELAAFWDEAFANGRVAGAYWAIITNCSTPEELRKRVFGEVHMLSHVLGRTTHASASRASDLAARVEELEARLLRENQRHQDALAERDARICQLEADMAAVRRPPRIDHGNEPAAALTRRTAGLLLRRERALISARQRARAAETENERLKARMQQLLRARPVVANPAASQSCPGAEACRLDLPQRRVLYLGGRARTIERLKSIAADANAELYHHDGGLEQTVELIDGLITRCDAVFCPVDCISHGACERAKALCRKLAKPFVPLRSSGASSFKRALNSLHRAM